MKKITLFLSILFSLGLFAESQNGVVYVKAGASGTGESWADALGDIQEAIALARSTTDARKDVWVAAGEFTISTALNIVDSVNVYGSFVGTETSVDARAKVANARIWDFSHPTILKGSGARLVQAAGPLKMETVIDGFIMTDGNGAGSQTNGSGGAAMIRPNVVLQNCIIRNNTSEAAGGGVMMNLGGTVRNCLIKDNIHTIGGNGGGGIFCNTSSGGYNAYIEHSDITGNTSTVRGAGIGVQGSTDTYISSCRIYNNTAIDGTTLKGGGGLFANSANNRVINSVIHNNTGASAVYMNGGTFINNTVVKNVGGLYAAANSFNLTNNIVWGCATDASGVQATSISGVANSKSVANNNAVYNPLPTDKGWEMANNVLLSSNVSNGDVLEPADGTLGSGPKFAKVSSFIGISTTPEQALNLDSVNWSLNGNSPLVNLGKAETLVTHDITGLARPQGFPVEEAKYDIGAYELPYYTVVAGEGDSGNGIIYSSLGEIIAKDSKFGYAKGSKFELFFEPKPNYEMSRAYYTLSTDGGLTFTGNEVDFMANIDQDGFWTINVNSSFKVTVVWNAKTALKSLSESNIFCIGTYNGIEINGIPSAQKITVYDASGMHVLTVQANNQRMSIPLKQGLYIVKMSQGAQKVIVK